MEGTEADMEGTEVVTEEDMEVMARGQQSQDTATTALAMDTLPTGVTEAATLEGIVPPTDIIEQSTPFLVLRSLSSSSNTLPAVCFSFIIGSFFRNKMLHLSRFYCD